MSDMMRRAKSKEQELAEAMALLESPLPEVDVVSLQGERVVEEEAAGRLYPGCSYTHPTMYPGKMVPVWAIELRGKLLEVAGRDNEGWVREVLKSFGRWKASGRAKALAVLTVTSVARLAKPGQVPLRVEQWMVAGGLPEMKKRGVVREPDDGAP